MRKFFTLLIAIFAFSSVCKAQYVNIPDINFRNFLKVKYPECFNSEDKMDTTCPAILNESKLIVSPYVYPYYPFTTDGPINNGEGVQYFKSLKELQFFHVKIGRIPELPDSLIKLVCYWSSFESLPALPKTLTYLYCELGENLKSLPPLPESLEYLFCYRCPLQTLPQLPKTLKSLDCSADQLTKLPELPSTLKYLSCGSNPIASLPHLPPSLDTLLCGDCNLVSLPLLPDSMSLLECYGNKIYCLPKLPVTRPFKIVCDEEKITCIPNNAPNISTYYYNDEGLRETRFPFYPPLCDSGASNNHCNVYPRIIGFVYSDDNRNGIQDNGEPYRPDVKISLSNGTSVLSSSNGYFEVLANDTGNFTFTPVPPAFYTSVPASVNYSFSSYDTVIFQNCALQVSTVKDSLVVFMSPLQRRVVAGYAFGYTIKYKNTGSTVLYPDIIFNFDSTKISNIYGVNLPHVINGNGILINPGILAPGESGDFILLFEINGTDEYGDTLLFKTTINGGEATASDSNKVTVYTVTDANAKEATRQLSPQEAASGKYISYTIFFQNKGTDTVHNMVIKDTLSSQLQWNTLEMLNSSHTCSMTLDKNRISFKFPGIMLPPGNINDTVPWYGSVTFRLKPKSTLQENTIIGNKASIYFDENAPVVTNTAQTIISDQPVVFTFNGKGNWNEQSNWLNGWKPGNTIPAGVMIIINPTGGSCLINVPVTFLKGANIIIKEGKNLIVNGMLTIN